MDGSPLPKATISTQGRATLRLHPDKLIMLSRIRSEEATLELGLNDLKKKCEHTAVRLKRLGAVRVDVGEPHEDNHSETDPLARMQTSAMARVKKSGDSSVTPRRGVNRTLTAIWPIAGMSGEQICLLVDNLRFDAAADVEPPEPPQAPSPWESPEDQVKTMIANMNAPPPLDLSPKFLYVSQPTEEQCESATGDAYRMSRKTADKLASMTGRRVGELHSLICSIPRMDISGGLHMTKQRCEGLLSASALPLSKEAVVMDSPWPIEIEFSLSASHYLV